MADPYFGREQTRAKHFILRHYLQELAFKVLRSWDVTYVDGFSGPWESKTEDFADSSFRIAIDVLRDAQQRLTGLRRRPKVRCFFSENNREAFDQLQAAITPFHDVSQSFEVQAFYGNFEDAVSEIQAYIGSSFPLIFIDPTGWTGYSFDKIRPLFERRKCEVLINFMYDFVNRAASMSDPKTVSSLDPILGGPGWEKKLDLNLHRGRAVEKLFRDTLREIGGFKFVVSTKIDRATVDRPHFFIAYGTKSRDGLKAFRETEYQALRAHARSRANARERKRESKSGSPDLFAGLDADVQEATIGELIEEQKAAASEDLMASLARHGSLKFSNVVDQVLQGHMLRETDVKDICVELANVGKIENTWGGGNRKPRDENTIRLKTNSG